MGSYRNTRNYENLERRIFAGVGEYDIPQLKATQFDGGCEFVGFNKALQCTHGQDKGVHFFLDDYQFNRLWTNIDRYAPILARFKYVMTPDYSLYTDFPKAIQIYNHYRKHWVGAYLQELGLNVIPTITWSTPDSYDWCFDGEPESGTVAVSSVGCMKNAQSRKLFVDGYAEMVSRLRPEKIIFYGVVPNECAGNIVRINAFQDKFRAVERDGR